MRIINWSSGNAFVSGAGGLSFKFRTGQVGHRVAIASPPLRHFFERRRVARNLQWSGSCFGGLGAKPPEAGSTGGLANFLFFVLVF